MLIWGNRRKLIPTTAFLSIGQAAHQLGVSVDTVRRLADAGKLRSVRSRKGARQFSLGDLTAYQTSRGVTIAEAAIKLNTTTHRIRQITQTQG